MKTIYILWLRQLKRYIRTRSRVIANLIQPLLFLFALGFGLGPIYTKGGGGNYFQFLAPGVIGMSILFSAIFTGMEIIWDKQFGFLKETLVAPVSRFHIMLGRTMGGATVATIQGLIVFGVSLIAGFRPVSFGGTLLAFLFMFGLATLFSALGSLIAAKLDDMQSFPIIINFVIMPLFFLSGSLFPLTGIPTVLLAVTRINPLSYGIDGLRGALINASHFGMAADLGILLAVTLVLLWIGSRLFEGIEA
jgi:ABC-2 type transport system permease protein